MDVEVDAGGKRYGVKDHITVRALSSAYRKMVELMLSYSDELVVAQRYFVHRGIGVDDEDVGELGCASRERFLLAAMLG